MATLLTFLLLLLLLLVVSATVADPIPPPDLTRCLPALKSDNVTTVQCCLPLAFNNITISNIVDFTPPAFSATRVRSPAHLLDPSYIANYSKAVKIMRSLPPNHPWSDYQQANIHCAYCNGAYNVSNLALQVHSSWLFFPFHRMYIYFYERILGKLIGDDSFALPFWNWDAPDGMSIPDIYADSDSALFDPSRNQNHLPPKIFDHHYVENKEERNVSDDILIEMNLNSMYRQMVRAKTAILFFGRPYLLGMEPSPGAGSIEGVPHNTVHSWTGDVRQENLEDMGAFYSAARDPIFYANHANIDRMWTIWPTLPGRNWRGFEDSVDWLNSSFIFWDDNFQLVRVRVRDSLDTVKLGYVYQNVSIPWTTYKPRKLDSCSAGKKVEKPMKLVRLPASLDEVVSVEVERLKVGRSEEEKKREEEVLVVDNIEFVESESIRFDVYVNVVGGHDGEFTQDSLNFGGSFVHLPTRMGGGPTMVMRTRFSLGLNELLGDIKGEGEDKIVVSLVPKKGGDRVKVGDVRIEFDN